MRLDIFDLMHFKPRKIYPPQKLRLGPD